MLGSALYYPYIDIRSGEWLRSAILFWDEIQTIVPSSVKHPYHSPDTEICEQEGYLRPLRCDFHQDLLNRLGKRVISLLQRPDWLSELYGRRSTNDPTIKSLKKTEDVGEEVRNDLHGVGIYPEKMTPELQEILVQLGVGRIHSQEFPPELLRLLRLSGVHPNKLSHELKRLFGYREEYEGDWFIVDSRFSQAYMAALAAELAKEVQLSPLTSEDASQGLNLRCLIDDVAASGPSDAKGALLTLVMESIRVDPEVPIQRLIAFRRRKAAQLAELSGIFDDLRAQIEKSEDGSDLTEKAKKLFVNKVRPGLEKLRGELNDQAIQSVWSGIARTATVSVAAGSALATFTDWPSSTLLGAGAFLTVADIAVKSYFANRKARASSPYSYLFDVQRKFSLPRWIEK